MLTTLILSLSMLGQQLPADAPILYKEKNLTCADWPRVANHYISIGERKAIEELLDRSGKSPSKFMISSEHAERICRLLYVPKPGKTLRGPRIGPFILPDQSRSSDRWPEFPFANEEGVWFLLTGGVGGYGGTGAPEPVKDYIEYCQTNGAFRTEPLIVPSSAQAKRALELLLRSERWDPWYGQKWKSSASTEGLRRQADF